MGWELLLVTLLTIIGTAIGIIYFCMCRLEDKDKKNTLEQDSVVIGLGAGIGGGVGLGIIGILYGLWYLLQFLIWVNSI